MKHAASTTPAEQTESAATQATLPRPLLIFLWTAAGLTIAALLFSIIARHLGYGLPYSNPYYFSPGDRFGDFQGFKEKYKAFGSPVFFTAKEGFFMYPAPMVWVIRVFMLTIDHASALFVTFMLIVFAALTAAFTAILRRAGLRGAALALFVSGTVLLSYPMLFVMMRWNIEVLIFLLTSLGLWAFHRERFYMAAFYFGLATSLKFFPLIFFGLLFARKRYRETAVGVLVAVAVTLISLKMLGPSISQAFQWDNFQMAQFRLHFAGVPAALGYDHSAFGLIKFLMLRRSHDLAAWVTPYTRGAALLGLVLYFGRIWKMPVLNQILCISVLAVTLAPTSYDYTLLSLYPAFMLLCLRALEVRHHRAGVGRPVWLNTYFVLFALIFTPLSFVVWNGGRYAAQLRFIALAVVLVMALVRPLPDTAAANTLASA